MKIDSLPYPGLRALVANIQDAVVVLDSSGQTLFESPSLKAVLQPDPQGTQIPFGLDRVHPEERDAAVDLFRRTIAVPGAVARATYRFGRPDGGWQHLEAVAKNLLEDPDLRGVLITFRDVSDRIDALARTRESAEARDRFLATMSHELRTPIHGILGWAELLLASQNEGAEEAATQIGNAGRHLLRVVEQALDLAAMGEALRDFANDRFDLNVLVGEIVGLLTPIAEERSLLLQLSAGTDPVEVRADQTRVRQILLNLVGNALKFTPTGGDVIVTVSEMGERIRCTVADSGPGVAPERLDDLFRRYSRVEDTSSTTPGSGLGLAISREMAERMGGSMGVESRPGIGSKFWMEIPGSARTMRSSALKGGGYDSKLNPPGMGRGARPWPTANRIGVGDGFDGLKPQGE